MVKSEKNKKKQPHDQGKPRASLDYAVWAWSSYHPPSWNPPTGELCPKAPGLCSWGASSPAKIDVLTLFCSLSLTPSPSGMVEMIPNAETLRKIQVEHGVTGSFKDRPLADWLQKHNPGEDEYEKVGDCGLWLRHHQTRTHTD